MLDYETLRVIWWLLLGTLLTGFAVTDGFDLGTAALVRVLGKDDDERRCVLETVEPIWEGNQVWIIKSEERRVGKAVPGKPEPVKKEKEEKGANDR